MSDPHPVGQLLREAAFGSPPRADGSWSRQLPWTPGLFGIITFTGHAVLCVSEQWSDADLARLDPDGFGGAADPRVVVALAGRDGWIDSLDLVLAAPGLGGTPRLLQPRPDLADEPRARRAASLRTDVRVHGAAAGDDALVVIGRGIGGLPELSVEIAPQARGEGLARKLIADARHLVAPDDVLLVSVAPGNVASLRATIAAGFRPVAGVQLFRPEVDGG
ncbi:N-acetyltransferase [Flexivirga sp. B27]